MLDPEYRALAADIYRACYLTGDFTLRSGRKASFYFDKYQFEAQPALLRRVCQMLAPLVPPGTEVLAGLEVGGIPIVTGLSFVTGLPAAFVRKRAKEYGTAKLAEGAEMAGRNVLVVEDVVTSGGQIALSTADIRRLGAQVDAAICVVDRVEGGREALLEHNIDLISLFTGPDLERAASD